MSEIHSMRSGWGSPSPSPTSATSGASSNGLRLGGVSCAWPKSSVRAQSLMARSSEASSFGTSCCTRSSLTLRKRSERSCAEESMLRRSWLILLTARPRAASRFFWLGLHGGKLALGGADLVAPPRRRDDARRVLRPLAETHHVPGELGHGLDQKHVEREIDERRGDDRDQDRQPENVEAVADHRRFERSLLHHHLDEFAGGEVRLADDADHPIGGLGVDHKRVADQGEPARVAEIVGGIDLGRPG